MKLVKRSILSVLALLLTFGVFSFTSAEAATSPQWPVRYNKAWEYDGCIITNHQGGDIRVRVKVYGIHKGEQSMTYWELRDWSTNKTISVQYIWDYDGNLYFENLPKGSYSLTWVAQNNNESAGFYQVFSNGGEIFR